MSMPSPPMPSPPMMMPPQGGGGGGGQGNGNPGMIRATMQVQSYFFPEGEASVLPAGTGNGPKKGDSGRPTGQPTPAVANAPTSATKTQAPGAANAPTSSSKSLLVAPKGADRPTTGSTGPQGGARPGEKSAGPVKNDKPTSASASATGRK